MLRLGLELGLGIGRVRVRVRVGFRSEGNGRMEGDKRSGGRDWTQSRDIQEPSGTEHTFGHTIQNEQMTFEN